MRSQGFVRLFRSVLPALAAVVLAAAAAAQNAVVARNVNLRAGPSTQNPVIEHLEPSDELWVLSAQTTGGYYQARTVSGSRGWVWGRNIRITGPISDPSPSRPPDDYRGCAPEGNASSVRYRTANRLKNRVTTPAPSDIEPQATLQAMLQTGDDRTRWNDTRAASIVGYVHDVKPGGVETVNCGERDARFRDTHIEVVPSPTSTGHALRVIVEVTPRWRAFMDQQGEDWSTSALASRLEQRWVRFTGWLFWDFPHADEARNTNPGGSHVWRATAWEIHPVTGIQPCPNNSPVGCD